MALAAGNPFTFGGPFGAGSIGIEIGGLHAELHFHVKCPKQRKHERRHETVKNGHDTSVKGHPQQHHCKTCGANFYTHTSGYFHGLFKQLKQLLKRALKGGRLDLRQLAAKFDLSPSAASRLLAALLRRLGELAELKRYKELPRGGKVIFCDETFLKIQGEQWYIVVLRNEEGKVLDAFLTRRRDAGTLLPHFRKVMTRMKRGVEFIATDDFTAYQAVVLALEADMVHVRCVHKPPYGRVIIDVVKWEGGVAHYTTVATISDVLKEENTFLARVSQRVKKPKAATGKRGRRRGNKNRPKDVIAAEKAEKAKQKEKGPKKRGRKKWSREGEVHVFHYDPDACEVRPEGGSNEAVAKLFTKLLAYFAGKCITTNTEEEFFSAFKRLMHFSGWRLPEHWQDLIDLYVVLRQEKSAVAHLVDSLEFRPHMLRKNLGKLASFKIHSTTP